MRKGLNSQPVSSPLLSRAGEADASQLEEDARQTGGRLADRLGLNVPYEWWPRAATLKAIEAAGFGWIQVASPPVDMLADPRHAMRHARALADGLDVTGLNVVVHGPTNLRLGSSLHNRAGECLIEYAHQVGAAQVVYHALDWRRPGPESQAEEHALRLLARWAEMLDVVVCLENLCPVYPGDSRMSHDTAAVRDLVLRCGSPAVGMLLDVGHANVVAELEGAELASLVEPVADVISLFHVHDNFGSRRRGGEELVLDPLRLDLHLPPSAGSLPWSSIARMLASHSAPLMLEVHPAHRPSSSRLRELAEAVLLGYSGGGTESPANIPTPLV